MAELEPTEAMRLISQPGVVTRVVQAGGDYNAFFDGDVLVAFDLPDGRTVNYVATHESDYYGGHYDLIRWDLVDGDRKEG